MFPPFNWLCTGVTGKKGNKVARAKKVSFHACYFFFLFNPLLYNADSSCLVVGYR